MPAGTTERVACVTRRRKDRRRAGCPLAEEVGSGRFCPGFILAAWMASDSDCRRRCWRCFTCGRVQLGAVAESTIVGRLDRWVYADESDVAADTGLRDGPGDARPWGGHVDALPAGEISRTYGTTTVGGRVPVSLADHVRIGSITKTWTGTVILQQAHEGKLASMTRYRSSAPMFRAATTSPSPSC